MFITLAIILIVIKIIEAQTGTDLPALNTDGIVDFMVNMIVLATEKLGGLIKYLLSFLQ
ncbi:hypothetical protein [Niallia taxi]|uniref:hypothetical protein n=1 Tax=Niallia taxi TaxID=2499688 RepID=UPI0015F5A589|nr:hypothetical protein [Niallia taxi]